MKCWFPFPERNGSGPNSTALQCRDDPDTGPSELGWSRPMSKNPLERAWPQWDQRRLSNRREQILHFDLSRKGREAIPLTKLKNSRPGSCPYTYPQQTERIKVECVKTRQMSCSANPMKKLLITTYQEVNDQIWSNTCCDDENVWIGGNTSLPEQLFTKTKKRIKHFSWRVSTDGGILLVIWLWPGNR